MSTGGEEEEEEEEEEEVEEKEDEEKDKEEHKHGEVFVCVCVFVLLVSHTARNTSCICIQYPFSQHYSAQQLLFSNCVIQINNPNKTIIL